MGRYRSALPTDVELELRAHVESMQRRLYGLTMFDMRRLAYDVADRFGVRHPFDRESRMAGLDWARGFLKRHGLSLRKPQGTSMSRAAGFNKTQVKRFFDLYKELLETHEYPASRVWNMDETGLTTVQKPVKVMASRGIRQVGRVTSAERGDLVTFVCACSATGVFLPPMYIFPRKRMVTSLMNNAPPQAVGYPSHSGWTDSELFLRWLEHFCQFTNCSKDSPHLILLDGHHSHKTLEAVDFCRANGIELLTFPPHCTHKLQPLDKTYFKPLKSAYNREADSWMVNHPGRRITVHEVAEISGRAFLRTALPAAAVNGFRICGLWPFDPNIFEEGDFEASLITDEQANGHDATSQDIPPPPEVDEFLPTVDQDEHPLEENDATDHASPCVPVNTSVSPLSSNTQGIRFRHINTSGDGRCLFRSIVVSLDSHLQDIARDIHGVPVNQMDSLKEKTQADGLRGQMVTFMCNQYDDYKDLSPEIINADQPSQNKYSSIDHRIETMAEPTTMPGELEITALSKVLRKMIVVLNAENVVLQRYGDEASEDSPIFLQFRSVGQDVGHYSCLLPDGENTPDTENSTATVDMPSNEEGLTGTTASQVPNMPTVKEVIENLSPLPSVSSSSKRGESSAIITSSPYKRSLSVKASKKKQKRAKQAKKSKNDDDCPCIVCTEQYSKSRPGEIWVRCQVCQQWAHDQCTPGLAQFICPNCDDE